MQRGAKEYPIPLVLTNAGISQDLYGKWLDKVTTPHLLRDRKRLVGQTIERKVYRVAIHKAVVESNGKDYYTGEPLNWKLLQHFSGSTVSTTAKGSKRASQEMTPTLDHENLSAKHPVFRICSMRTNKCKSDYSIDTLLDFSRKLIAYQSTKGSH